LHIRPQTLRMSEGEYPALRQALRDALAHDTDSYAQLSERSKTVRSIAMAEISRAVTASLNAEAKQRPQDTLIEKRELAAWVNHELRHMGLTLAFPGTGRPAILTATPGRRDADEGSRFRLESKDEQGRRVMSASLEWIPELEPIENPPRIEGGARHR